MVESKAALPGGEVETAVSLHGRSVLPNHSLYIKDFFARQVPRITSLFPPNLFLYVNLVTMEYLRF